jgi:hypothetical protein
VDLERMNTLSNEWSFTLAPFLLQLRFDLDVKFLSNYVDRLNQSGYDDAKNLYTKGAHFRPVATVTVPGGLSVALGRGDSLYGNGTTLSPVRLTVSAATGINATLLVLNYAGDRFCAVGGLGSTEQTTSGCKLDIRDALLLYS